MVSQLVPGVGALVRLSGYALVGGGALAASLNLVLTPMLPRGGGTAVVATSLAFGLRLPLAAASVALVTLGAIGLYLAQAERLRRGGLAFLLAFFGGLTAFCVECVQFTLVRDLAFAAPETLEALEQAGSLSRYDIGFGVGAGIFLLGWLAVAVVTLRAGLLPSRGPATLLGGMLLVPLLGALLGVWGAVIGNLVLGGGWVLLGIDLLGSASETEAA